jgi:hypothetical protein
VGKEKDGARLNNVQETHIRKCTGGKELASRNSNLICGTAYWGRSIEYIICWVVRVVKITTQHNQ